MQMHTSIHHIVRLKYMFTIIENYSVKLFCFVLVSFYFFGNRVCLLRCISSKYHKVSVTF